MLPTVLELSCYNLEMSISVNHGCLLKVWFGVGNVGCQYSQSEIGYKGERPRYTHFFLRM